MLDQVIARDMLHARLFAEVAHKDQIYDGKPYVEAHLDLVAQEVYEFTKDPVYIAVAYLHDTIEDTGTSLQDIADNFGWTIAHAVFAVTDRPGSSRFERQYMTYAACRENPISLAVKLCDRIVNMRASFKTVHALTYVNEYERFKGSLYVLSADDGELWDKLDILNEDLKKDIHDNNSLYIDLSKVRQ